MRDEASRNLTFVDANVVIDGLGTVVQAHVVELAEYEWRGSNGTRWMCAVARDAFRISPNLHPTRTNRERPEQVGVWNAKVRRAGRRHSGDSVRPTAVVEVDVPVR